MQQQQQQTLFYDWIALLVQSSSFVGLKYQMIQRFYYGYSSSNNIKRKNNSNSNTDTDTKNKNKNKNRRCCHKNNNTILRTVDFVIRILLVPILLLLVLCSYSVDAYLIIGGSKEVPTISTIGCRSILCSRTRSLQVPTRMMMMMLIPERPVFGFALFPNTQQQQIHTEGCRKDIHNSNHHRTNNHYHKQKQQKQQKQPKQPKQMNSFVALHQQSSSFHCTNDNNNNNNNNNSNNISKSSSSYILRSYYRKGGRQSVGTRKRHIMNNDDNVIPKTTTIPKTSLSSINSPTSCSTMSTTNSNYSTNSNSVGNSYNNKNYYNRFSFRRLQEKMTENEYIKRLKNVNRKKLLKRLLVPLFVLWLLSRILFGGGGSGSDTIPTSSSSNTINYVYYESSIVETRRIGEDGKTMETIRKENIRTNIPGIQAAATTTTTREEKEQQQQQQQQQNPIKSTIIISPKSSPYFLNLDDDSYFFSRPGNIMNNNK